MLLAKWNICTNNFYLPNDTKLFSMVYNLFMSCREWQCNNGYCTKWALFNTLFLFFPFFLSVHTFLKRRYINIFDCYFRFTGYYICRHLGHGPTPGPGYSGPSSAEQWLGYNMWHSWQRKDNTGFTNSSHTPGKGLQGETDSRFENTSEQCTTGLHTAITAGLWWCVWF